MQKKRPTQEEIIEALDQLAELRERFKSEGAYFRANVVGTAIDLIKRLAPSKTDGHGE